MTTRVEGAIAGRMTAAQVGDLESVMATAAGRRFAYFLVYELAGVQSLVFDAGVKDGTCHSQHMAFSDGMRAVGLILAEELKRHCPDAWWAAHDERMTRARHDAALRSDEQRRKDKDHG